MRSDQGKVLPEAAPTLLFSDEVLAAISGGQYSSSSGPFIIT